jgi:hypothetical protein
MASEAFRTAFAAKSVLALRSEFVRTLHPHPRGVLSLPSVLTARPFILAPGDDRRRHHNQKHCRNPSDSLSHNRFSFCPHLNHTITGPELLHQISLKKHI